MKVAKAAFAVAVASIVISIAGASLAYAETAESWEGSIPASDACQDLEIQSALDHALGGDTSVTITLEAGTHYISTKLKIYSNTHLILADGAVLTRTISNITEGMIYNFPENGEERDSVGGYDMSHDITIEGQGTAVIDGGDIGIVDYIDADLSTASSDLIRIDHARNVSVTNLTIKNCYDCHHVEFVGVKDGSITNCSFSGFKYRIGHEMKPRYAREAIQLDSAWHNTLAIHGNERIWAKGGCMDGTSCQNCTVDSCTFTDLPSAVGQHHWSTEEGYINSSNITISNNVISNSLGKGLKAAITGCGLDNLVVTGNSIVGPFKYGIYISHSSGDAVKDNKFSGMTKIGIIVEDGAADLTLDHNKIVSVAKQGIAVASDDEILYPIANLNIINNTIKKIGKKGIYISNGAVAKIGSNALSKITGHAIYIAGGTIGVEGKSSKGVVGNTISKCSSTSYNGVTISGSKVVVYNIAKNSIASKVKNGISISNKAKVYTISKNTISLVRHIGIWLGGSSKVKTQVNSNKVTVRKGCYGITGNVKYSSSKNKVKYC